MITGSAGSIQVWLWVMVAMAIVLVAIVIAGMQLAVTIVLKPDYEWRASKTFKGLVALCLLFVGLGIWYRIDSHPLRVARSDAINAAGYFQDAEGVPEILTVRFDDMPTFWWPDRPQPRMVSPASECNNTHPASSVARLSTPPVDDVGPHFANIKQRLDSDGWDTFTPPAVASSPDTKPTETLLIAFRDNRSLSITASNNHPDVTHYSLSVNSTCREQLPPQFEDN